MSQAEEWRDIAGWDRHVVSDLGRARTYERRTASGYMSGGSVLVPARDDHGRLQVTLKDGKRRRRALVAELVLEAFGPRRQAGTVPVYRNGRPWDCRLPNLRWGQAGKPSGELVSLREAHEDGMFGSVTYAGLRTAANRSGTFPEAASSRGTASLYERAALAAWWGCRAPG